MPRKHDDSGFLGKAPHEVPTNTVSHWNRYLARDPPSYDSGTLLSEADVKIIMDKMEARSKWLKANGKARPYLGKHQRLILARAKSEVGHRPSCDDPDRVREGYEKSTIAGDDPKAFRDKYRFTLHGETGTDLCKIWAAMQREAYKSEGSKPPSSKPLKNHCSLAQAFARSIFCFSPAMAMLAWAGAGQKTVCRRRCVTLLRLM